MSYRRFRAAANAAVPAVAVAASAYGSHFAFLNGAAASEPDEDASAPRLSDVHLIQSQIVFRHGARAPVHRHASIDTSRGWVGFPRLPPSAPSVARVLASTGKRAYSRVYLCACTGRVCAFRVGSARIANRVAASITLGGGERPSSATLRVHAHTSLPCARSRLS